MSELIHNHLLGTEFTSNSDTDFIGFTFNGVHSSELGIIRISDGSRFNENLLPTMQDEITHAPGADGTYYFGSYYTQRVFDIPFAFDSLTEFQLAQLKRHFGDKKIHTLIFDEVPYKAYQVKVTGTATIKYIPFVQKISNEDEQEQRVYKGEGSVQFTAYYPFAKSVYKFLDNYPDSMNKSEWNIAANLLETQGKYDKKDDNYATVPLYNPGDLPTDFILTLTPSTDETYIPLGQIRLQTGSTVLGELSLNQINLKSEDASIKINTKLKLIEGYNSNGQRTGNIYNKDIKGGDFFKIPNNINSIRIVFDGGQGIAKRFTSIEYDYLYY